MGQIHHSAATLRIFSDDLRPDEISQMLKCEPTKAELKGDVIHYPSGRERTVKRGNWRLVAKNAEPEDLDGQIRWLMSQVSDDLNVWKSLTHACDVDLFCGLFMQSSNDGFSLSSETMLMLGQRGIELGLDIYDASDEDDFFSNLQLDTNATRQST
jgi:Domain of unknown function (DUF4279)